MKLTAASVALVVAALSSSASAATPPEVTLDGRDSYRLLEHLQYLEDPDRSLTLEQARAARDGWTPYQRPDPNFGFTSSAYWIRLRVHNPADAERRLLLSFKYRLLDRIEAHVERADGSFARYLLGDRLPHDDRAVPTTRLAMPIDLEPQTSAWIYLRVVTSSSMQIGLDLHSEGGFIESDTTWHLWAGIYYGIMIVMALYNLFLYIAVRSRSYLLYVVFVVIFAFTQTALDGVANRYFFADWPAGGNTFTPFMVSLTQLPALLFTQNFLETRKHAPVLHHVLTGLGVLSVVATVLALTVPYAISVRFGAALALVTSIACEITGIRVWRAGYRPARFYVFAWTSLIIGTFMYGLLSFGLLPANAFTINIQRIGSAIEVSLLSFALGDRISMIEREREQARAEALELDHAMALTGAVQELFLPKTDTRTGPPLSLAGFLRSATRCGGDWWWHEELEDGRLLVVVGDVSGHGAGAAIMTGVVASTYHSLQSQPGGVTPEALLGSLHEQFHGLAGGDHHLCVCAITVDPESHDLEIWSAGAPPVFVLSADGEVHPLMSAGGLLGIDNLNLGRESYNLSMGDRVLVLSDGLPELIKPNGRQLGYMGVLKMLAKTQEMSIVEARADLIDQLDAARGSEPQRDDITFVLVDFDLPA